MTTQPKGAQRSRTDSDLPEHMIEGNPTLGGGLTREQVSHGEGRRPRVPLNTGGFKLSVPEGTISAGKVGYWFEDDNQGRILEAQAAWWEHVTDSDGANIYRRSGARKVYLMAIDKVYYDEDEKLRESNYRATIGEIDDKPLGEGVESYTPSGEKNKIKVSSDPFDVD